MRTLVRLLTVGAVFGVVAVGAASASQTTPVLIPTFTISITGIPSSIARGDKVTVHVVITNLTDAAAIAQSSWKVVPPKATSAFFPRGSFSVLVPAKAAFTKDLKFTMPAYAPKGTYTFTTSVVGGVAPAVGTFDVT